MKSIQIIKTTYIDAAPTAVYNYYLANNANNPVLQRLAVETREIACVVDER